MRTEGPEDSEARIESGWGGRIPNQVVVSPLGKPHHTQL